MGSDLAVSGVEPWTSLNARSTWSWRCRWPWPSASCRRPWSWSPALNDIRWVILARWSNLIQDSVCSGFRISLFYPIWSYWACFAPGSTTRHPFLQLSQNTFRDAPPRGNWLRTRHWWREVGKVRRKRNKHSTELTTPWLRGLCYTLCYHCGPLYFSWS